MRKSDGACVVPAIIADEWDSLIEQIHEVASVAMRVQIDVMDGVLVPSFSFPYNTTMLDGQRLPFAEQIHFEAHLMVQHPAEVGRRFIAAGARTVIPQIEGFRDGEALHVVAEWQELGASVGVSLMLDTPLAHIDDLIEQAGVSLVQVMSIARVGFQGERFDERALVRIRELRRRHPHVTIAVDGGVKEAWLEPLSEAGVTHFGIGSAIMGTRNPERAYTALSETLAQYAQRHKNTGT